MGTLQRLGVAIHPIVAGLPLGEEELKAAGGHIDWEVWVDFMDALERELGREGAVEAFAAATHTVNLHQFQGVARLLSSPIALYQLNSRWGVPSQYRHMRSTCEVLPHGRVHLGLTIPQSYRGSLSVFRVALGLLRSIPRLIGLPDSKVVSFEITPHSLSVVMEPPRSRTLVSHVLRLGERVAGLGSMLTQLGDQEVALNEKSAKLELQLEEQRRVEGALRVSEERWRALAENVPGIILILSEVGELISVSRAFRGLEPEALVGRSLLSLVDEGDREELSRAVQRVKSELLVADVRLHFGEGADESFYACRLGPIVGESKLLLCAFLTDISERIRAERELREREDELARNQRLEALGRLAGGVAHDFNNLLTVIRGGAELLLDSGGLDTEQREEVVQIDKASERAATLTRQLLAFSRQQVIAPQPLQLAELLNSARPMLARLMGEDIQLEVCAEEALPFVMLDASQVDQILMNLAVNARDAMPRGGTLSIELRTSHITPGAAFLQRLPAGRYVELVVRDTGLGMEKEVLARIFEPFFSKKQSGTGTGLGLAIVRGIAAQSGGDVDVESELGRGTTFRLRFPVCAQPEQSSEQELTPAPSRSLTGESVLVVEDDAQVRSLVAKILRGHGYRVIECDGAVQALEVAKHESFDLLLSDVVMPEISGPELARLLSGSRPEIAVLFMSGYAEHEIVHRGIVNPGVSLLVKPFSSEALLASVRERLDQSLRERRKSS